MGKSKPRRQKKLELAQLRGDSHCEPCGKITHRSRAAAKTYAQRFRNGQRPYACPVGEGFHLGHLPTAIRRGDFSRGQKYDVRKLA